MSDRAWITLYIVNLPIYLFLGKILFNDWDGVGKTLATLFGFSKYSPVPVQFDFLMTVFRIVYWLFLCYLCVRGEAYLIRKFWVTTG